MSRLEDGNEKKTENCRVCHRAVPEGAVTTCGREPCPFKMSAFSRISFYISHGLLEEQSNNKGGDQSALT